MEDILKKLRRYPSSKSLSFDDLDRIKSYDLMKLAEDLKLSRQLISELNDQTNEEAAALLIRKAIPGAKTRVNMGINGLPILYSSTNTRPDVFVTHGQNAMVVEVHSSSYSISVKKAILVGVDLLRLVRSSYDKSMFTVYAFPKRFEPSTVCKIIIGWNRSSKFKFSYEIIPLEISDVIPSLNECLRSGQKLPSATSNRNLLIRLLQSEMDKIAENCQQIDSKTSIVFTNQEYVYKVFQSPSMEFINFIQETRGDCNFLQIELITWFGYKYKKIKYDSLSRQEARECIVDFVKGVRKRLKDLHALSLAHNDLRLDNVCFNDDYEVVLIDMDGVKDAEDAYHFHFDSCMYKPLRINNNEWLILNTDYLQLGCIIMWTMNDYTCSYHQMKFEVEEVQEPFLRKLLFEGIFDENCFARWHGKLTNQKTIKEIIDMRY
jgi:hypothetical protein